MMAGVQMQHVPYRGAAPALADLIGGQLQVIFDNMPSSIAHIQGGRLRALAVCSVKRHDALPDVPTVGEFLPGFDASATFVKVLDLLAFHETRLSDVVGSGDIDFEHVKQELGYGDSEEEDDNDAPEDQ